MVLFNTGRHCNWSEKREAAEGKKNDKDVEKVRSVKKSLYV